MASTTEQALDPISHDMKLAAVVISGVFHKAPACNETLKEIIYGIAELAYGVSFTRDLATATALQERFVAMCRTTSVTLKHDDRIQLRDGRLGVLFQIEDDLALVRLDGDVDGMEVRLAEVRRLFGRGDRVVVDGQEHEVLHYSTDQCYRCLNLARGNERDVHAREIHPLPAEGTR
ncbi:hypothetical protein OG339_47995 (plasmid) [Streptosporangium sp. NBC_01495]|uniref:hypothetical protein n=1 Tax=Streptosporangium sp. NBC_01495 TaxID=2903899 RepID=UPI002E2FCE6A|nr:hypothetical protein [Streptosporangium sp. NBC_01495]